MPLGLHLFENVLDLAVGANDERRPRHAHHLLAVHILFLDHAVSIADCFICVSDEREWQVELFGELLLRLHCVRRNTEHHRTRLFDLVERFAEPASFNRSSRGVGTRVEIEYDPFAFVIFEGDFVAVLVKRSKVRGFIIDFHGILSPSV